MGLMVSPLPGWNVRGYSYGQVQPDGQIHPGADLNVGAGDEDLGLEVVACAKGVVVERVDWDGSSVGFGNAALVRHDVAGVELWGLYAHLDEILGGIEVGRELAVGEPLGRCGKSGRQTWAHLHFELRYRDRPATAWPRGWPLEAISAEYGDPFTLMRVLGGLEGFAPSVWPPAPGVAEQLAHWQAKAFGFEDYLRKLAGHRRKVPGDIVERIVSRVPPVGGGGS